MISPAEPRHSCAYQSSGHRCAVYDWGPCHDAGSCMWLCRLLAAMVPGQSTDPQQPTPAPAPKQYGPTASRQSTPRQATTSERATVGSTQHASSSRGAHDNTGHHAQVKPQESAQHRGSSLPLGHVRHQQGPCERQGVPSEGLRAPSRQSSCSTANRQGSHQALGSSAFGARAGQRADQGRGSADGTQLLMLQEDEADWDSSSPSDPALQHALAVIRAKGVGTVTFSQRHVSELRPCLTFFASIQQSCS